MEKQGQSSRRSELQGPRPTPLKVRKDSHKIRKPPVAPQPAAPPAQPPPRAPVIIYAVSPKVIHTSPSGFMALVQRLTGPDNSSTTTYRTRSDAFASTATSALSPAARFAVIEKTNIPGESKSNYNSMSVEEMDTSGNDISGIRPGGGFIQSILSPGPTGLLRPFPPTFFSPISDPSPLVNLYYQQNHLFHQDNVNALPQQFSQGGVGGGSSILPSPSAGAFLSPNPMLSPASIEFLSRILNP